MAYFDIALLTNDSDFISRVSASFISESPESGTPYIWVADHIWQIAGSPGFGDAYASAILNGIANPGRDQSVISDSQILSAVQPLINAP